MNKKESSPILKLRIALVSLVLIGICDALRRGSSRNSNSKRLLKRKTTAEIEVEFRHKLAMITISELPHFAL